VAALVSRVPRFGRTACYLLRANESRRVVRREGPGGKTWGLTIPKATPFDVVPGTKNWQIYPSIDVKANGDAHPGNGNRASSLGTRRRKSLVCQTASRGRVEMLRDPSEGG